MSFRSRILLVLVWCVSLFALAGALSSAQTPSPRLPDTSVPSNIVSGSDLGFRVDRHDGVTPVGTFVIRENGQWVELRESVALRRLTNR